MERLLSIAFAAVLPFGSAPPATSKRKTAVDQGARWSRTDRAALSSQAQGSGIMPPRRLFALRQPIGDRFMADTRARYGHLTNGENPASASTATPSPARRYKSARPAPGSDSDPGVEKP
jgi:hypothetical protein